MEALPDQLQPFARDILTKPLVKSKRVFDAGKVSDHHAILPTGRKVDPGTLPPAERGVYMLVCKRLAAAFMPEHRYEQTSVVTECVGHRFRSSGRVVRQAGWKAVYADTSAAPAREDGAQPLPPLRQGDTRTVRDVTIKEDKTKPPPHLTDATLLSAMEHAGQKIDDEALREAMRSSGLGTPATRAAILERLLQVGYARREGKAIVATDKGARLIDVAPPILTDPALTGKWEKALNDIAVGDGKGERFRTAARRLAASLVEQAREARVTVVFDKEEAARTKRTAARAKSMAKPRTKTNS